ncbi:MULTISPECIES: molybdopterin molybdotransferase MoeA [unclassified Sphingomonas]|uniref:molybdopterin molybdotransferase MoeA n=1 Tax=unclassified Sphingomonas TaxID=196159 RepID=UPI00083230D2|nr:MULTISPECIES: molybdopterin molybdotransferase MoeA [unclassified Sphingomonas]
MHDQPIERGACIARIGYDAAQAILALHASPLGIERLGLADGAGRVLAEPVVARIDSPRRDCAAMDGYAVRTVDLRQLASFNLIGSAFPGTREAGTIGPGETMRIMTGAPLPIGADRVVVTERSQRIGSQVRLAGDVADRSHVRRRGSDFAAGTALLPQGQVLDPFAITSAAAADVVEVVVFRRPRVAILVTGDELVPAGAAAAGPYLVPDSLSIALGAFAERWGAASVVTARVGDDAAAIRSASQSIAENADVLVVTGGASRGDADHCRAALAALGLEMAFADLAIKPGKPAWFGRIGALHVLGLPGNPTAALTVARLFLAPLLAGLGGRPISGAVDCYQMILSAPAPVNGDREAFLCGSIERSGVQVLDRQSASSQAQLVRTQCLIRRQPGAAPLGVGSLVDVLRLYP